ncbi:hypothetical protein [Nocardia nova]|uniref:hypothetical protein n=1 Tax=Nocardia nova TaxID=37330 RepID=UPI00189478FE|nr:hypothetical protein [Nocardia nova]MBF6150284.1 hypothetical protein [Nocardia nova]
MNRFVSQQHPADCQAIDFRAECNAPDTAQVQVPVHEQAPGHGMPVVTPDAPPVPGAHTGPLAHLDGFHLPHISAEGALDVASVSGVLGGSVAAVATAALAASWYWTWNPVRLRNFAMGAACALPGAALLLDGWSGPREDITRAITEISSGSLAQGAATAAIATVPAGWMAASLLRARFAHQLETRGLSSPVKTQRVAANRRRREMAAATRMSAAPLPLVSGTLNPEPVIGRAATVATTDPARSMAGRVRGRYESLFKVLWLAMREHFVAVGNPGSGKTTMLNRTAVAFWATAWRRHQQWWRSDRTGRPLLIIIDVKGARDARRNAKTLKRAFEAMGGDPDRVAIWPDDGQGNKTALRFFGGDARELRARFEGMLGAGMTIEGMDPAEAYYIQMRKAVLHLVIDAPNPKEDKEAGEDPPRGFFEYLDRMNQAELVRRWANYPDELGAIKAVTANAKNPILDSERTAMMNLARELGEEFEGEADLTDYDLVYCCLEGITSPLIAQAQFGALVAMLTMLAGTDHGRCIQLFVDEFAQVCGDSGAARIVELLRSAGIGSGWFAQSWMGLGANDDQRHRLVDSCSGGIFAMRSNSAGQLAEKIGTGQRIAISRKLIGGGKLGDEGNVQPDDSFLVPPSVLAKFEPGDIVHARGGVVRFGHISVLDTDALQPLPGLSASTQAADETADPSKGDPK